MSKIDGILAGLIAGIIMGPGGLGLLNTGITSDMTIIESVLFMIIAANMMRNTCKSVSMSDLLRLLGRVLWNGSYTLWATKQVL